MIIGTVHSKSVGKTTIAVHLAGWLAEYGYSVAGIDADWQKQFTKWLAPAAPQVKCRTESDPEEIERLAGELSQKYDVVIIDGPAGLHLTPGAVLIASDAVIVPCGPTAPEIDALAMVETAIRQVQEVRAEESETAMPYPIIVPVKTKKRTRATTILKEEAAKLGFQSTANTIPFSETYASLLGFRDTKPRLLWQLGRSRPVREAVLNLDALFQEMLPEVAEQDPTLFERKMAEPMTRRKRIVKKTEEHDGNQLAANG